jgi:hypothetical protein
MRATLLCLLFSICALQYSAQVACEPIFEMKFSNNLLVGGPSSFGVAVQGSGGAFETDREGNQNCAYRFYDSETDFLQVEDDGILNFDPSDEFSISLWYRGGSGEGADEEMLIQHGSQYWYWSPTQMDYFMMLYDLNQPSFMSAWYSVYANMNDWMNDTLTWHHLVGVYTGQTATLYFDNLLAETQELDEYEYNSIGSFLQIGKGFGGVLDDVQIFDCALNADDVNALYNQESLCSICNGDFNGDSSINTSDLLLFVSSIGCTSTCAPFDLTGDGIVGTADVIVFVSLIGITCSD